MKAMVIRDYGGPEVFEASDLPKPEIKTGHVLVRIAATSVNTVDTMIRQMVMTRHSNSLPVRDDVQILNRVCEC